MRATKLATTPRVLSRYCLSAFMRIIYLWRPERSRGHII